MFKSCSIHLFPTCSVGHGQKANGGKCCTKNKKNMAPVPYREGIDTEAKAPCWGAARHAVSDWSKQRVLICWRVHGRSLIVLASVSTHSWLFLLLQCCLKVTGMHISTEAEELLQKRCGSEMLRCLFFLCSL